VAGSRAAIAIPIAATTANIRSQRWSAGSPGTRRRAAAGPAAARAPNEPARYAAALYLPKRWILTSSGAPASIACSREVIGPDSLASVDSVPVAAASRRAGRHEVSANTEPLIPMIASRPP
jgi:hypothetical protein